MSEIESKEMQDSKPKREKPILSRGTKTVAKISIVLPNKLRPDQHEEYFWKYLQTNLEELKRAKGITIVVQVPEMFKLKVSEPDE